MKRVILDIDDAYADILSITAFGVRARGCRAESFVSTGAYVLSEGVHLVIDENGKTEQRRDMEWANGSA